MNNEKIVKTIELDKNIQSLALAMAVADANFSKAVKIARKKYPNPDNCTNEIKSHLFALSKLYESLNNMLWEQINKLIPEKYINNEMRVNPHLGKVVISNKIDSNNELSMDAVLKNSPISGRA